MTSRFALSALLGCVGWFALLGAAYFPIAAFTAIGLSSRVDSGEWNTVDDPTIFAPLLGFVGLVGGVAVGVVSGVVVAVSLASSSGRSAEQHGRRVATLSAGIVVLLMTGVVTVYFLGAPSDALIWDIMARPVWVLFSCLVPTTMAAALVYWRAPSWS